MFPLPQASTAALPLDEVLARLSRHPTVTAIDFEAILCSALAATERQAVRQLTR